MLNEFMCHYMYCRSHKAKCVLLAVNYTEDLLTVHEREVTEMKEYYSMHEKILKLVEKRECYFHKMIEFEVSLTV